MSNKMDFKQKNFVSTVIYIRESETKIESFLKSLYSVLHENFDKFEIICVDDASTDNSAETIRSVTRNFEDCMLSVVHLSFHQGIESAMLAGIDLAIGDFVFEFDETVMDYEPHLIMQCYERCLQGFDIVSCGNGSLRVSSRLFYLLYNNYSGTQYDLKSETFRVISRRGINRIHSMSTNTPYRKALYYNCGLKADYMHYDSTGATTKRRNNLKNPHDTALTSLLLFTNIAYKVTLVFSILMMLATLSIAGYVAAVYITGNPVAGYTTMMVLISGAFFALFAIMAVIIKYLSVILRVVFHKQKYVFESIEKITGRD